MRRQPDYRFYDRDEKSEWDGRSRYDTPFMHDTRKLLEQSANANTIRHALERMGWKYQRFTSFINSLFGRKKKMVFMTPLDKEDVDPGLRLEVMMRGGRMIGYLITR